MDVGKFLFKPKLVIYKLKTWKDINFSIIAQKEVVYVVGKRQQNKWKVQEKDFVTNEKCYTLLKFYEELYAHPLTNGVYLAIFLRGWLTQ
jgi:hypothetical protein